MKPLIALIFCACVSFAQVQINSNSLFFVINNDNLNFYEKVIEKNYSNSSSWSVSLMYSQQKRDTLFIAYSSKFMQKIEYESEKIWFTLKDNNQGSEWIAFEEKRHIKGLKPQKITCFESLLNDAKALTYTNEQESEFKIDHWKLDLYLENYTSIFLVKENMFIQVSPIYAIID
ncbi:hypothetical protein [Capnocytophaga cynodegmi]|uniref:hypothetical protein n=1 Tax=Capnocytophaga cynodegmi TaxID=28189 RepID=UPI0003648149|nr:hypothetical protein [Capnocytophaga cynodegmi]CEN42273.1 exported hypothetical protein [Capnocytophaga cynodegmi]